MIAKIIEIFRTERTVPFLSFLIGMGLSILFFHKPIYSKKTLGIPIADVENKTVRYEGKCYQYVAEDSECEIPSTK